MYGSSVYVYTNTYANFRVNQSNDLGDLRQSHKSTMLANILGAQHQDSHVAQTQTSTVHEASEEGTFPCSTAAQLKAYGPE